MDTGAGGTISGPLAASGGPDASSTYGGLDPSDVELSPAVTTVAFSPAPLPPLRLPVKAGPGDSPERGKWVLAFQDEASWRGAWGACERKIGEQCEVGARMGCSVRATTRCQEALPWGLRGAGGGFLGVMELLGVGGGGGRGGEEEEKEREACEEREMMACLATAQDACREHAQQQCATAFSQALIARSLTSIPLPLLDRRAQRALLRAALHRRQTAAAAEGSGRGGSRGGGPGGGGGAAGAGGADVERSPGAKLAQQAAAAGLVAGGRGGGGLGGRWGGGRGGGAVERGEREGAASGGRGGRRGVEKWVVVSGDPESGQGGGGGDGRAVREKDGESGGGRGSSARHTAAGGAESGSCSGDTWDPKPWTAQGQALPAVGSREVSGMLRALQHAADALKSKVTQGAGTDISRR
ncbi:hypothetical protein CLOP_g14084 [Closterium sp. NIES-67]|nr:hypothetical protein CLOP_g14084 [Closterium sp. NIES-67]